MPNLDAANISFNLLKMTGGEGVTWADPVAPPTGAHPHADRDGAADVNMTACAWWMPTRSSARCFEDGASPGSDAARRLIATRGRNLALPGRRIACINTSCGVQHIFLSQTESADRYLACQAGMRAVPIVTVQPVRQVLGAFSRMPVGTGVGPFAQRRLDEALGLAVGLRPIGFGEQMSQARAWQVRAKTLE